jgi:hypothetical protein
VTRREIRHANSVTVITIMLAANASKTRLRIGATFAPAPTGRTAIRPDSESNRFKSVRKSATDS